MKFNLQWPNVYSQISELKTSKEKIEFLEEYLIISKKFIFLVKERKNIIYGLDKKTNWPLYYTGDKSMDEYFETFINDVINWMRSAQFNTPVDNSFVTYDEVIEYSNLLIKEFKSYTLPRVELELEHLRINKVSRKSVTNIIKIGTIWEKNDDQFINLIERLKEEKFLVLVNEGVDNIKKCFLQPYEPPSKKFNWTGPKITLVFLINALIAQGFVSEEFVRINWKVTSEIFIDKDLNEFTPEQLKKLNYRLMNTRHTLHSDKINSILKDIKV